MLISAFCKKKYLPEFALAAIGAAALAVILYVAPDALAAVQPKRSCSGKTFDHARWADTRARAIRQLGIEAVPLILREVPKEAPFHFETVCALSRLGPGAIPALIEALDDANIEVQLVALRALASFSFETDSRSAELVEALSHLLTHPSNDVRYGVILLLGRIQCDRSLAVPGLINALSDPGTDPEEDPVYVRQGAAYLLGKIGPHGAAAVPALREAINDPTSGIQQEAAIALWRITHDSTLVLSHLSRMLGGTNVVLRHQAIAALGRIRRDSGYHSSDDELGGKALEPN